MPSLTRLDDGEDDAVVLDLEGNGVEADEGSQDLDGRGVVRGVDRAPARGCSDGSLLRAG